MKEWIALCVVLCFVACMVIGAVLASGKIGRDDE